MFVLSFALPHSIYPFENQKRWEKNYTYSPACKVGTAIFNRYSIRMPAVLLALFNFITTSKDQLHT